MCTHLMVSLKFMMLELKEVSSAIISSVFKSGGLLHWISKTAIQYFQNWQIILPSTHLGQDSKENWLLGRQMSVNLSNVKSDSNLLYPVLAQLYVIFSPWAGGFWLSKEDEPRLESSGGVGGSTQWDPYKFIKVFAIIF